MAQNVSTNVSLIFIYDHPMLGRYLNLKVRGRQDSMISVKIREHAPLSKLMAAYGAFIGIPKQEIRFRSQGQALIPDNTPADTKITEGDTIDTYLPLTGGGSKSLKYPKKRSYQPITKPKHDCSDLIRLFTYIKDISSDTPIQPTIANSPVDSAVPEKTNPKDDRSTHIKINVLGLDNAIIETYRQQTGGGNEQNEEIASALTKKMTHLNIFAPSTNHSCCHKYQKEDSPRNLSRHAHAPKTTGPMV